MNYIHIWIIKSFFFKRGFTYTSFSQVYFLRGESQSISPGIDTSSCSTHTSESVWKPFLSYHINETILKAGPCKRNVVKKKSRFLSTNHRWSKKSVVTFAADSCWTHFQTCSLWSCLNDGISVSASNSWSCCSESTYRRLRQTEKTPSTPMLTLQMCWSSSEIQMPVH